MTLTGQNARALLLAFGIYCFGLVLVQPATANPQSDDEATIEKVVEQFCDAYTKEDLDGFMELWSADSPDFANRKKTMQRIFDSNDNIQVKSLNVVKVKVEENKAKVRLAMEMTATDVKTYELSKSFGKMNRTLDLVKVKGVWKISRYVPTEQDLGDALVAVKTKEERTRLLNEEKEMVTAHLVSTLYRAGDTKAKEGKFDDALRYNDVAIEVAEVLGRRTEQAWCYIYRARTFYYQRQYQASLTEFQRAQQLFIAMKDRSGESAALGNIGVIYKNMGQYAEALDAYQACARIFNEIGNKQGEASIRTNIGALYVSMNRYTDALTHYQTSQKIAKAIRDRGLESTILNDIGVIYKNTGRYAEALEAYQASLNINTESGDTAGQGMTLLNLGNVYRLMGKYASSLKSYQEARTILNRLDRTAGERAILNGMGRLYQLMGRDAEAMESYETALSIAKKTKDRVAMPMLLLNIASLHDSAGRYDRALEIYEDALTIVKEVENKSDEGRLHNNIAIAHHGKREYGLALAAYNAALKIERDIGDKSGEARTLFNMASQYKSVGQYTEASETYKASQAIFDSIGETRGVLQAYTGIGDVQAAQKQWKGAIESFEKAINLVEQIREDTEEPSLQMSFFEQFTFPYYALVTSWVAINKAEEGFRTAERAKARTLVELLAGNHSEITKLMTTDEKRTEQELNERIMLANLEWRSVQNQEQLNPDRLDTAKQHLASARRAYDTFRRQIYIKYPQLEAQRGKFSPLTIAQAKQWLATEGAVDLLVLEYVVGDDQTWLFALNENSELTVSSISLTRQEIEEQINDLQSGMLEVGKGEDADASILAKLKPALQKLEMLVAPASHMLSQASQVCIVPDDLLWNVPFAAIKTAENKYLIETHTVFYAPSVTALKAQVEARKKRPPATGQLLAMAPFATTATAGTISPRKLPLRGEFGPLKYSGEEVKAVSALFGETAPFLGKDATETVAKLRASEASILHFATHGLFDESYGLNSGILFAEEQGEDGYLEAREILDLDLNAELVVLSACETARGQLSHGEGIIGLSWAFFVAGCSSTVVSQWKVADESTAKLMTGFYENLKEGKNKDEALRQAQLSLLSQPEWKHPFYWAPFILVGNWQSASSE